MQMTDNSLVLEQRHRPLGSCEAAQLRWTWKFQGLVQCFLACFPSWSQTLLAYPVAGLSL